MTDAQLAQRGIFDTATVINLERVEARHLPVELAASAITVAELAASPLATGAAEEQALQPDRHHREEVDFDQFL